jgi:hypothetical protein
MVCPTKCLYQKVIQVANTSNGYATSLSKKIFERLIKIQTDRILKQTRPRLSGSGFLFNRKDIERVIMEHDVQ